MTDPMEAARRIVAEYSPITNPCPWAHNMEVIDIARALLSREPDPRVQPVEAIVLRLVTPKLKAAMEECEAGKLSFKEAWAKLIEASEVRSLSALPPEPARDAADAARYRHLRDHCSCHYPMTHEQPAEWSIQWDFQQRTPDEAWGTFDSLIDKDIAWRAAQDAGEPNPPSPPQGE